MTSSFPTSRVTRIIKADPDVQICTKEAVFLISRLTEIMVDKLTKQAYENTHIGTGKQKSVAYKNLANAVLRDEWFYLADVVPQHGPLKTNVQTKNTRKQLTNEDAPSHRGQAEDLEMQDS